MKTPAEIDPYEIIKDVTFYAGTAPSVRLHEATGFAEITGQPDVPEDKVRLIGFAAIYNSDGTINQDDVVTSPTSIAQLALPERRHNVLSKGLGERMYRTAASLGGTEHWPGRTIGVYSFDINPAPAHLFDASSLVTGAARTVKWQLAKQRQAKATSLEEMVEVVQEGYDGAEAAYYPLPLRPRTRQMVRRIGNRGIAPAFIKVLSPAIPMHRIGIAPTPWTPLLPHHS